MVSEGDSVPKFTVNDANGNKVKSSDFKGKKHAIYFYPKDFTPGCTTEADEFSKDYKKFQKEGIEIIGVVQMMLNLIKNSATRWESSIHYWQM